MRTQGTRKYKRKIHILNNAERKKHVSTPKIDEHIETALTPWRRQKEGQVRTQKKRPSKRHSLSGNGRGRDKSGHGKKVTEQGVLTGWRRQREGQVRTQKQSDQARGTHELETAEGGTSQDMERKQLSKGHSQTGDGRGRDKSGHRKKPLRKGAHKLEMAEGGTSQDTERK